MSHLDDDAPTYGIAVTTMPAKKAVAIIREVTLRNNCSVGEWSDDDLAETVPLFISLGQHVEDALVKRAEHAAKQGYVPTWLG